MANASQKDVKVLIELCTDVEEADRIIKDYYGFETIREKVAFLKGMFDTSIVGHEREEPNQDTYNMMLHTIINAKWN